MQKTKMLRLSVLSAAVLAGLPVISFGQTDGKIATQAAANWTTAPWTITAGAGTYPDGGGVATWNPVVAATPGTVGAGATLTLNVPITLSGISYNSPFSLTLAGSAVNNLALPTSGGTLDTQLSIANSPTLFQLANSITAPITGGGAVGLTKSGAYIATLGATANSTYTGGTHINGGMLVMSVLAAVGDNVLGAAGAGNGISFNGGALFNNITGGWTTSRTISIDAGGGTMYANTAVNLNGVISGAGTFRPQGFAAVAYTFTAANTLTGAIDDSGSSVSALTLSGNGAFASASSYNLAGTLSLTNATTNINDRIADSAAITLHGATITLAGNAAAATSETIGAVTLNDGINTITVTPNAAQATTITAASFIRQNNSSLFVRGTSLGAASAANVANVISTSAPTLVGAGGTAGSTTISVIPWAIGNTSATGTLSSSFLTHGATGFRPLAAAEYAAAFGGSNDDNVRLTAATAAGAGVTANSLVFAPAVAATLSGGPINITSGGFLYSPTATVTGTVSAGLSFGAAEGVISTTNTLNISGVIDGSGGITVNPILGSTVTLTGANTYTGPTTLLSGITQYSGTITNDGTPSPLGAGTSAASPIVFEAGNAVTRLWASAASTINRDIKIVGTGPGAVDLGTSGTTYTVTVNGNIDMQRNLFLDAGTSATAAMILNGVVSGPGTLSDLSGSFNILNGNNTYTGGTNTGTGCYAAGSDTAFGTGTIYFSAAGFIQSKDTTPHVLANSLFISANPTIRGTGALTFTGGVNLNGARSLAVTNTATTTFSGVVSNGALTKTGAGLLVLSSPTGNPYTGGTVVSGGKLQLDNTSGSATGPGAVSVSAGATIGGTGTITGPITLVGTGGIAPGDSPGTLTVGPLTMSNTSAVLFELGLPGIVGSGVNDLGVVNGNLTLDGLLTVSGLPGFTTGLYTLFTYTGTLTDNTLSIASLPGTATANVITSTPGVVLLDVTVPEPTSLALIGAAMVGGLMRRRRAV